MISDLIVIYRALGSQDESASLEEQADKVLYFKQDISINAQLSQLTLVEGLIEFTTKFSKQNIKTAVLDRKIWCFYEPEPDVWIVSSHPIMANGVYPAQNSQGLYDALQETYRAYHLLFGKIADSVDLEHFATIQKQRKRLRKAKQAIYTAQQDTDITEDVINDIFDSDKDYHSLPETLITLFEDYSQAKDTLTTSLSSTRYNIPPLRNQLSAFLNWHASFWSAAEGSFLAGIPKTINPHLTGFSKAALVHRILRVISQQIDDSLLLGTFIAHDGAVLWSDFAPHSTSSLSHLLCQLDCSHLLALKELSDDYLMGGNTSSTTGNSANMSSSSTPSMRGRVDDIEEVRRDAKARMFQDILNDRISRQV